MLKFRHIAILFIVGILLASAIGVLSASSGKYTMTANVPVANMGPLRPPDIGVWHMNFTSEKVSMWDYLLQGKGHSGATYQESNMSLWLNFTDSQGKRVDRLWAFVWTINMTNPNPGNLTFKFPGVSPGPGMLYWTERVNLAYNFNPPTNIVWFGTYKVNVGS